jgi:hypothetical protein
LYVLGSAGLVCTLVIAAHAGGNLVHGETYLTRYAPYPIKAWLPSDTESIDLATVNDLYFVETVNPLLQTYCYGCHGDEKQKGGVQISALNPDFVNGHDAPKWHATLDMINAGEMPPRKSSQPSDDERRIIVDWMTQGIAKAKASHKGKSKQVIQRLTKQQYSNTLQDLLGITINFEDELPDDPLSEIGFSNNAELLSSSNLHLETFQTIAREALTKVINIGNKPKVSHYRMHFGKDIGKNEPNTLSSGYMDVPLAKQDFYLEILNEQGEAKSGRNIDEIKPYFSASLRGSDPRRFSVKEKGITLYSALPHKETTISGQYGAWNGPSPNLAMQIKDQYPREGDFVVRIKAKKDNGFGVPEQNASTLVNYKPQVKLDGNNIPITLEKNDRNTMVLSAKNITSSTGFSEEINHDRMLTPNNNTAHITGEFIIRTKGIGGDYFQIDIVHPEVSEDSMSNITININNDITFNAPLYPTGKAEIGDTVTSSIGVAYLLRGKKLALRLTTDTNFPGFSDIVLTKLEKDTDIAQSLNVNYADNTKYEKSIPEIIPYIGTRTDDGMDYKTFSKSVQVDPTLPNHKLYSFYGRLENLPIPFHGTQGDHITSSSLKVGLWNNHLVKNENEFGSPLNIEYIEFEAPYFEQWPTKSHKAIFLENPQQLPPPAYAKKIISRFASKAFRRSLNQEEIALYVNYWNSIKNDYTTFEESIKETLVAVLTSTNFLYLAPDEIETPLEAQVTQTKIDDELEGHNTNTLMTNILGISTANASQAHSTNVTQFALASRLSYFLWNSPPDQELLLLAKQGQLENQLTQQVTRMLADDKLMRFVNVFTQQWLRIDRQQNQTIDISTYPDYTRFVKQDMALETQHFFRHLLQKNLSALNLIDADFTLLNQNLAEFYGIDGVNGNAFNKVTLKKNILRGGLLSQGAFLTGHADGVHSHPVKRAVWLKEKILGDTPPPPPPNVPELDPETPGFEKLTLKQQLELHRDKESCRDCHAKIDPFGVAFEKYDAVGRLRTAYKGREIDDAVTLPDGTNVKGIQEIKDYLLNIQKDQVMLSVIKHLYAYALAKEVSFHDEDALNEILNQSKNNNYKMRDIVTAIIKSPAFINASDS